MTASTRILRTCAQVLAALVAVVPSIVAVAHAFGVELDGAALAATGAAAVAVVAAVQNALEAAGKVPVLGATKPQGGPLPASPPVDDRNGGPELLFIPTAGGQVAEQNAQGLTPVTSGPAERIKNDPAITEESVRD